MRRMLLTAVVAGTLAVTLPPARAGELPAVAAPSVGTAWYPEQWPRARWDKDLRLMRAANMRWVRLAEFSWSTLEPSEGDYRLDWLAEAVRAAERHGLKVVLGTPSAAPPAWLTARYPDVLKVYRDGRRAEHGSRAHFDWSSPRYRELVGRVVARMAERFGHDRNVIGWQIDNEYDEESYGPDDRRRFQDWLRDHYGTLDRLNAAWTTAYWSQTYSDWAQVPIPPERGANPGLALAWRRFVTDEWRGYQRAQRDVLRARIDPRQKITTNLLGQIERFDVAAVTADLDFASWDYYVGGGRFDPTANGFDHDLVRGFLGRPFWVMETQPGQVNWAGVNAAPRPGELRAMAWNAVAHGADAIGYWQWRSALGGQEQYHGALLDTAGRSLPALEEVSRIGAEFARAERALAGTEVRARVAVLNDYPSRWAWNGQRHHEKFDPVTPMRRVYAALHRATGAVDVVSPAAALARYRIVFAPSLNLLTPAAAANLAAYVRGGGQLVLGARSAMKDDENRLWAAGQPGPLAALLGAHVRQFYVLDEPVPLTGRLGAARALLWADTFALDAPDIEVLARYAQPGGWVDGTPAVIARRVGAGGIAYAGADLDEAGTASLVTLLLERAGVRAALPATAPGIDVSVREGAGRRLLIVTATAAGGVVAFARPVRDVLAGRTIARVTLPPFGVAVVEEAVPARR